MNTLSIVIIIVVVIACLGLLGSLLHVRSQRQQSEVHRKQAQERYELQHRVDKLKDGLEDQQRKQ